MSDSKTAGFADAGGDHPLSVASKPATSGPPTVTHDEEKPNLPFSSVAAKVTQGFSSNATPTTSHPVGAGQILPPSQTLSHSNSDTSTPCTMAGNGAHADIIHQVYDTENNITTVTVRGGRYDTATSDPVKQASAEVMKGRKISKPKGKSRTRPTMASAVSTSVDTVANSTQNTGLQSPGAPARASGLAPLMKEQQHEPSNISSLLDEIANPVVTTYSPHPSTSQSLLKPQHQDPRIGSLPDKINQPKTTAYTPHPPISQSHSNQENKLSSDSVVSSVCITPQDEIPVSPSTAAAFNQDASLQVPQPITSPPPLAAPTNSNIPLFLLSMLPNWNKHFTTTQNPGSSSSYSCWSSSYTDRSVTPYSPSTAMRTKQTKEEDVFERYVHSQMKPYPVPSGDFGNPRPGPSFNPCTDKTIQPVTTVLMPENNMVLADYATSPLFGQAAQLEPLHTTPSARPSLSEILRDSPTNPKWRPASHSIFHPIPPIFQPSLSDKMEDLQHEVAAIIPQPMYRPTVNNEMGELDTITEPVHSTSTAPYIEEDAEPTIDPPPAGDVASADVETKEEVFVIKDDEPSSSEEVVTTPECSEAVQNIGVKQVDLDPKYFKYRNKETRTSRLFQWDIEDNRDPSSGDDCEDKEMKEIITKLVQLKLHYRVSECSTPTRDNDIRIDECPTATLDNEIQVTECPTTIMDKELRVVEFQTVVLNNEIVPKNDGTIEDLCAVEPTSVADPLADHTTHNLQVALKKQSFKIEQLQKELTEQTEKRVRIWRSTVEEAVATRLGKKHALMVAELHHRERLLAMERSKFEADCEDREEELTSREKDLASKEQEYGRRLQDLQTREAQVVESTKFFELWQGEQKERDRTAAFKLEMAQKELGRLQREKKQGEDDAALGFRQVQEELKKLQTEKKMCEDDSALRFKRVEEELEGLKEEKKRAKLLFDAGQNPPTEVSKESPDILCNDSANLSSLSSSDSSKDHSLFINGREIEFEHTWSAFTDARVFECPHQIGQNLMFSSTWDREERLADGPGAPTRSHWKWVAPLLLVLALLSFMIPKLLLQPLSSRQDVILQHLPNNCSFVERPVTSLSSSSQTDSLCLADCSNNYFKVSSFPVSGLIDPPNDLRPLSKRSFDTARVRGAATSPSTWHVFKIWFWHFVLTGTAHARVGVEAGRRELHH